MWHRLKPIENLRQQLPESLRLVMALSLTNQTTRMPVLFVGHGSPMNAIEDNAFTRVLSDLGKTIARPRAILMVSAHWMTEGTWVTGMPKPKTIHDFYGFPQTLFDVQYPAPGSPETAKLIAAMIHEPKINIDLEMWGLDHGAWSVLKHIYPKADIPVVQLSLNIAKPAAYHFNLGQQLASLRDQGILIIGSGNLVHNLNRLNWESEAPPYDWAIAFDAWLKEKLTQRDFAAVMNDYHKTEAGKLSVPTLEHYYPLHYVLGAAHKDDELHFAYEAIQNASISMRTFLLQKVCDTDK
jgi:4,5-DOPA dioxygenase extradiol